MPKYSKLMVGYGIFLIVLGVIAWTTAIVTAPAPEPDEVRPHPAIRAITALVAPGVSGLLMIVMGWLSAQPGSLAKSFGVHAGFVIALLIGLTFSLVGYRRWTADEPLVFPATVITVVAISGFVIFFTLLSMRPKPEERGGQVV